MKYGVCERNCSDEDLATATDFLAEMGSNMILLEAHLMNFDEAHLASAILDAR